MCVCRRELLWRREDDDQRNYKEMTNCYLKVQSSTLGLLFTTKFKVLASLQSQLVLVLANVAFQTQDDLLGSLGLLVEDRLGLTTITGLFAVVTTLTLSEKGSLSGLVLGDLVRGVLAALLALAVGVAGLWDINLYTKYNQTNQYNTKQHDEYN